MLPIHKLIIELSKIEISDVSRENIIEYLESDIDWKEFFYQVVSHRIVGTVVLNLKIMNAEKKIPREVWRCLNDINVLSQYRQTIMRNEIEKIVFELQNKHVKYCIVKGEALQAIAYKEAVRMFRDIDILISKESYSVVEEIMKKLGYHSMASSKGGGLSKREYINAVLNSHEFPSFVKENKNAIFDKIYIDAQYEMMMSKKMNYNLNISEILKRSVVIEENSYKFNVLSPEDMIIHLCAHAFGDSTMVSEILKEKAFKLFKFLDIWLCCGKFENQIEQHDFVRKVKSSNTERPVYFCLKYVDDIYGLNAKFKEILLLLERIDGISKCLNMCGYEKKEGGVLEWKDDLENKLFKIKYNVDFFEKLEEINQEYGIYDASVKRS